MMIAACICLWIIPALGNAAEQPSNVTQPPQPALTLINQAIAACLDANRVLLVDIDLAERRLREYQQRLNEAMALEPGIGQNSALALPAAMTTCDRIRNRVNRVLGMKRLEQALKACDQARLALAQQDLSSAQHWLASYEEQRSQANRLSPGLEEVQAITRQVASCATMAAELSRQQMTVAQQLARLDQIRQEFNQAHQVCQQALRMLQANVVAGPTLIEANSLLAQSQRLSLSAQHQFGSLDWLKMENRQPLQSPTLKLPEELESGLIDVEIMAETAWSCEVEAIEQIRRALQQLSSRSSGD
jgi:tetratricopeptide (TPR) repeat protein